MNNPLSGQVALVTGAGSGIGEAVAQALGACGVQLALVGRRSTSLDALAHRIGLASPKVRSYICDLADEARIQDLAAMVQNDFASLDILVHSAGIFIGEDQALDLSAEFDRQNKVNLLAPQFLTEKLSSMFQPGRGQVVFINSSVARRVPADQGHYTATKIGLKTYADTLRREVNSKGVRVLSAFVGRTATPMQKAIAEKGGLEYKPERLLQPADVAAIIVNCLSLPFTAEVTEIDIRPMYKG
jgi:NAD(P)-dependent dehydrogenase (short-subunit alcohol dehydrogenase family)